MSSPPHTPNALFSLVPLDDNAEEVVAHPRNSDYASTLGDGQKVLTIGGALPRKPTTLVTLGREDQDILIPHTSASKSQCLFKFNPETNVVLVSDRTETNRTHILDGDSHVFRYESGRPRRVVVHHNINNVIAFSDKTTIFMKFRLEWHNASIQAFEKVKNQILPPEQKLSFRSARTFQDLEPTRICDSRTGEYYRMRYITLNSSQFGQTQQGSVSKVLDVDSGSFVALKILKPTGELPGNSTLIHEVLKGLEILTQEKQSGIIEYIATQDGDGPNKEIFMQPRDGTLDSLINNQVHVDFKSVLLNMLEALDFLGKNSIVHRGVKPENIYYRIRSDGQHVYELGGFGINNHLVDPNTFVGNLHHLAPEVLTEQRHTSKSDIWSLFVTMLWLIKPQELYQISFTYQGAIDYVISQSQVGNLAGIREIRGMAFINPSDRATAGDMLVKVFNYDRPKNEGGVHTPPKQHRDVATRDSVQQTWDNRPIQIQQSSSGLDPMVY